MSTDGHLSPQPGRLLPARGRDVRELAPASRGRGEETAGTPEKPSASPTAEAVTDYFIDVYAPSRSTRNQLRTFLGFIVDGPEYLTVFEGATGRELQAVRYKPDRTDDGLL
ncbi:hypothetical protein Aab01nite_00800 [Paractinoplanes abujensis]|uniref:Rhamnogalacturonan lyase family 11 C-terminal domain-containing protein n=1 Tax=Paractinoplanes abujensis TaxID=882441 RepID=A0A7W7G1G1_9ACTN|nr:hypothetical protein [Actinoplanes abujensis]MBB4692095.1 hypothetical protein [Actinoplanes abujensis]GID16490.1 hypothetical protein Aab01nite_00800 [Actinoplanes abujensis]